MWASFPTESYRCHLQRFVFYKIWRYCMSLALVQEKSQSDYKLRWWWVWSAAELTPLRTSISRDNESTGFLVLIEIRTDKRFQYFPTFSLKVRVKNVPCCSVVWFVSNTEMKLISESIVITGITTIKHLVFVCCVVVNEFRNLIILCEVELVRLNYQIKIGRFLEVRRLCLDHIQPVGNSQDLHLCPGPHHIAAGLPKSCKFWEFLNEIHNSASTVVDADFRSQVLVAHSSLLPPLCCRPTLPYQGSQTRWEWCSPTPSEQGQGEAVTWMNQVGKPLSRQRSKIGIIFIICPYSPNSLYNCSNHLYFCIY